MLEENDPAKRLLDAAAKETMERIRADAARKFAPQVTDFLNDLTEHLFEAGLAIGQTLKKLGIRDGGFSTNFGGYLGRSPKQYIVRRRLETADRLICRYGLPVGEAGSLVGFDGVRRFRDLYKAWCDENPSRAQKDPPPPQADYAIYRKGCRGELEREEGLALGEWFLELYGGRASGGALPSMLDRRSVEQRIAEGLWEEIRELPFDEQRRHVREYRFRGTALFDLLRRKSREEGRKDRQMGIRVAKLALASIEGCGDASGERVHDLRAQALACLGRARRLASDFFGADVEFADAWGEWRVPRSNPEPLVLAEICLHQGTLRMFQRRYDEALALLDKSIANARRAEDLRTEIQALSQRAALKVYMAALEEAAADFEELSALTKLAGDDFQRFIAEFNLLTAKVRCGRIEGTLGDLKQLKSDQARLEYPKGQYELLHLEGNINEEMGDYGSAEKRYSEARGGFGELNESRGGAFAALDLAIVLSRQGKHERVLLVVAELMPVLDSLQLQGETLAAVNILARAVDEMKITHEVLCGAREHLHRDPLLQQY